MTPWQTWANVVQLYKANRPQAANASYESLPKEFRIKLMQLAIWLIEYGEEIKVKVTFDSPYGQFTLTRHWVEDLLTTIVEVRNGNYE
jgi:hypothetical protein